MTMRDGVMKYADNLQQMYDNMMSAQRPGEAGREARHCGKAGRAREALKTRSMSG